MQVSPGHNIDYVLKVIVVGDSGVGKTNLLSRFVLDDFNTEIVPTIGAEFRHKCVNVDDKVIKAQIWDTAGEERFRAVTKMYYRSTAGVIVVFDITQRPTFDHLEKWLKDAHSYSEDPVIMIVGNKTDLQQSRDVTTEEAKSFCEKNQAIFIETSALDSSNVETAFQQLITEIYKHRKANGLIEDEQNQRDLHDRREAKSARKNGCC